MVTSPSLSLLSSPSQSSLSPSPTHHIHLTVTITDHDNTTITHQEHHHQKTITRTHTPNNQDNDDITRALTTHACLPAASDHELSGFGSGFSCFFFFLSFFFVQHAHTTQVFCLFVFVLIFPCAGV